MGGSQIIGRVVGQLGEARLGGLEMLNGIREALLFERDDAQGEVRQCAVGIFVTGREVLQGFGAGGGGRVAVGVG